MAYSAPAWNAVNFALPNGYTAPSWNAVNIDVSPGVRTLTLSGADWSGFGTAVLHNKTQYLFTSGADWSGFGTAIATKTQEIDPGLTVYTAPAWNALNFLLSTGWTAPAWNSLQCDLSANAGMVGPRFGLAAITNSAVVVSLNAAGIDSLRFGASEIEYFDRYLTLTGFDASAIGAAVMQRVAAPSGINALCIGSDYVDFSRRTLFPSGFDDASFGADIVGPHESWITPASIPGGAVGSGIACRDADSIIRCAGINAGVIGSNVISHSTTGPGTSRYVYPNPIATYGMGTVTISPHMIFCGGDRDNTLDGGCWGNFGTVVITNHIQYVYPIGADGARFGIGTWISHSPQTAQMQGFDHAVVWDAFGPVGLHGEPAAYVGYSNARTISPAGIAPAGLGGLMLLQNVKPSGADYSALGSVNVQAQIDVASSWGHGTTGDQLAMGFSRVTGFAGLNPIWGGLLVTDGGGGFYSYTTPAISMGDTSAFGATSISH